MRTRSRVEEVGGATDDHYANLTPLIVINIFIYEKSNKVVVIIVVAKWKIYTILFSRYFANLAPILFFSKLDHNMISSIGTKLRGLKNLADL